MVRKLQFQPARGYEMSLQIGSTLLTAAIALVGPSVNAQGPDHVDYNGKILTH